MPRMSLDLLFLGTGTSAGVPMIGCDCVVCTSDDPRDQRSRPSVMVSYPDAHDAARIRHLLIDTSPEMRTQVIRHGITHLDAVLYTHAHADHIFGLDDLRRFNAVMDGPIDIYGDQHTLEVLHAMFGYIFQAHKNINKSFVATLIAHEAKPGEAINLFGVTCTPLRLLHGRLPILGYRVDFGEGAGSLAYCTDVSSIPPETYPLLADLDVLVIDALRYRHHPTHMTVDQALEVVDRVKPKRAFFTHIAHDIMHADLEPKLPEGVMIAHDGLRVHCADSSATTPPRDDKRHGEL